jgi:hypothetical protein
MIPGSNSGLLSVGAGYQIDQSIRFDKTTSSHLSKTYGSAGDRKTWTFSTWFKRGKIDGTRQILFAATGQAYLQVGPDAASREMITILNEGTGTDLNWYTTAVYRDPSAWYHLVWQFDSTQATADDRTKLYINGSQVTDFTKAATPAQNFEGAISNAVEHKIGEGHTAANYFDGYQAEINFIDGTALDPTSFGETNDDGVWIPKAYTGSYGTNGFYITGEDSADLGADDSGNGNDFTSSGLTSADQVTDTPTDNYCVLSSIEPTSPTLSNGNLEFTDSDVDWHTARATFSLPSGKWYWECIATTSGNAGDPNFGIVEESVNTSTGFYQNAKAYAYSTRYDSVVNNNWTGTSRGTYTGGDILQIAYDADTGKLWFGINNSWINGGDPSSGTSPDFTTSTTDVFLPYVSIYNNKTGSINFGQLGFSYTPPTGFNALSTANLPAPAIKDGSAYFQTTLYTGNGSTLAVDQAGNSTFQPDLVWIKNRVVGATHHRLFDAVRGTTNAIYSSGTFAEATESGVTSFDADGFTLGSQSDSNGSGEGHVAWQWKANGSGSSNTDGSITSTVSANTTSGFSIGTYTGTGGNATVGHGLGVAPALVIIKERTGTYSGGWYTYHESTGATGYLRLQTTTAFTADSTFMNDTAPTSSVFSLGTNLGPNGTTTYVFYAFTEVEGYSKFGSYVGNASADGPFINCGFRPAFVLIKQSTTSARDWIIQDATRNPYNPANLQLLPNTAEAEATTFFSQSAEIDILSNGFKVRSSAARVSESGATYIYMAFAEHPFGGAGVAPATAR